MLEIGEHRDQLGTVIEQWAEASFEMSDTTLERLRLAMGGDLRAREQRLETAQRLLLEVAEQSLGARFQITSGRLRALAHLPTEAADLLEHAFESGLALTQPGFAEIGKPIQQPLGARPRPATLLGLCRLRSVRPPHSLAIAHDHSSVGGHASADRS